MSNETPLITTADVLAFKKPYEPIKIEIFDAAELEATVFPPVKSVVPGVIVEGLTLFCGKPKIGKSWFLLHAANAVARGGFTLGDAHCIEGDVLCCSLEDNKRRLQSRMRKLFGTQPRAQRLKFVTKMDRLAEGGLQFLRNWIESAANPRLVIIDTLAMVRMPNRKDQSSYDADYSAVIGLRDLAQEKGVAIVVVHHLRKAEGEDPFDNVSGTLGLTGCPDSIVILKRDTAGTQLLARGRDIEELEKAIEFDKRSCTWRIVGDAADVRQSSQRHQIKASMTEIGEPCTPVQIATEAGMPRGPVRMLMGKMVKDGQIRKLKRGQYELVKTAEEDADDIL